MIIITSPGEASTVLSWPTGGCIQNDDRTREIKKKNKGA